MGSKRYQQWGWLAALCLCAAPAWADNWSWRDADWGEVMLGAFSGIVAHETGHLVVAKSKGYPVGHDGLSITYPGAVYTGPGQFQLASAGYQVQWMWSEAVLRDEHWHERAGPPTDFGAGVVLSSAAVSLAYLTVLKEQYNGDVYGMSNATGLSHDRIALLMAIPAAVDTWRMMGSDVPSWVPRLGLAGKLVRMTWIWTY